MLRETKLPSSLLTPIYAQRWPQVRDKHKIQVFESLRFACRREVTTLMEDCVKYKLGDGGGPGHADALLKARSCSTVLLIAWFPVQVMISCMPDHCIHHSGSP